MRRLIALSAVALAATLPLSLTGCTPGAKPETKKPGDHGHDHGHDHDHDHAAHGPHEGHILEIGKEEYHAEWTHDDATGKVTVYVLDGEMKKEVPIAAESIAIKTSIKANGGDKENTFVLEPVGRSTGDKPMASQFEITDKTLLPILTSIGEGASATLELEINGKPFAVKFEAHSEHDHGHKH